MRRFLSLGYTVAVLSLAVVIPLAGGQVVSDIAGVRGVSAGPGLSESRDGQGVVTISLDTPVALSRGGTGATSAGAARTALGIARPLPVSEGGTGSTSAAAARTALGVSAIQGPQGPEGPQGPQGPVGPQGPQGVPGSGATLSAGAVRRTNLRTAVGGCSGTIPANGSRVCQLPLYSFFPRILRTTAAGTVRLTSTDGSSTDTSTTPAVGLLNLNTTNGAGYRVNALYVTASDQPSIWVAKDAAGAIHDIWWAEDLPPATPPIVLPDDPASNLLTVVSIGAPPLSLLQTLYDGAGTAVKLATLSSYLQGRGWIDVELTDVSQIQAVSERYRPAARYWALMIYADGDLPTFVTSRVRIGAENQWLLQGN